MLIPAEEQGSAGAPLRLQIDTMGQGHAPSCAVTNPRSGWNKIHNLCTFLCQISPDVLILSEHCGRKKPFGDALGSEH